MFQNSIIPNELSIYKFFNEFNLNLQLTNPQIKHLEYIMDSMMLKGYNGKMYDVATLVSQRHHTSISRFLSQSPWDESMITKCFQSKILDIIWARSKKTNKPIYIIIDDTISEKTKPSSKAINIIQKCSFHNSHLKGKTVYGHQIVAVLLSCDGVVLPYAVKLYDKNIMSKIDIATNLIKSMPKPINKGFVLCDSWYSCKSIFKASLEAGYNYIGAIKSNRILYPTDHKRLGIKLHKFATSLNKDDFNLVTVKSKEYYIYNYVGDLNDMKNISIILSYPKELFQKEGCLKAIISVDKSFNPLDILAIYSNRWAIEPFFRDCKNRLGLNSYQIRSEKSITRYLLIMILTYSYCKLYSKQEANFNVGLKLVQKNLKKSQVLWIYSQATKGDSIEKIFKALKIA